MNNHFVKSLKDARDEHKSQQVQWAEDAVHEIFDTTNTFETYINRKHHKYGITQISIAVLHTLVLNNGKLPQKRIPKIVTRSKQRVTSILANLEKRNLIVREIQGKDQRRRLVKITGEGLKIARECLPYKKQFYDSLLSTLTPQEGEYLVSILSKIRVCMTKDMKVTSKT